MTSAADLTARLAAERALAGAAFAGAASLDELKDTERLFLGRQSVLAEVNEAIKGLDGPERPVVGKAVGEFRAAISALVDARRAELAAADAEGAADRDRLDLTLGGHGAERGHLHLVTQVQRELEDIFVGMGYLVMEGPEVEDDYHFERLIDRNAAYSVAASSTGSSTTRPSNR